MLLWHIPDFQDDQAARCESPCIFKLSSYSFLRQNQTVDKLSLILACLVPDHTMNLGHVFMWSVHY